MIHLYAIVDGDHPGLDGVPGVGPHAGLVHLVAVGGVQAAVSEFPSEAALSDTDVVRYRDVVDRLFRHGTVLPVRLGTALADEAALQEQLSPAAEGFAQRLKSFAGKVEVEVTATYEDQSFRHNEFRARLSSASPEGEGPSLLLERGEAVSADLERRRAEDAQSFLERIHEIAVAAAERPSEPEIALRASILIDRDQRTDLDRLINRLREDTEGRVTWELSDPLPPYAFAGLALEESKARSEPDMT